MRRSGPLRRSKGLNSSARSVGPPGSPQALRGLQRGGLKPRAAHREALETQRSALVARLRLERPWCQRFGCKRSSSDAHEIKTRARGGSILDEANIVMLCREDHRWVHDHPDLATLEGLLANSLGMIVDPWD